MTVTDTKITLPESRRSRRTSTTSRADLPTPLPPPLHPGTREPIGPDALAPIFPMGLIAQEVSQERWIEIPDEVRDIYRLYRPSPMFRARAFEEALDTPAHIYYKSEHVSPVGSHKLNTAIMQAWVNKQEGVKRLATETGAGQWGSALSCACRLIGLECMVYMVRVSYDQKPYRRIMMKTYGADVVASPSTLTAAGRAILAERPGLARQPRHRHLGGGRGRGEARRHEVRARQRAQPRAAAPDDHRPGSEEADGAGRRVPRHPDRAATAAAATSRAWSFPFLQDKICRRAGRACARSRSSRRRARA